MNHFSDDLRSLRSGAGSTSSALSEDDFVLRVMTACTLETPAADVTAPQVVRSVAQRKRSLWAGATALVAAAAAAAGFWSRPSIAPQRDPGPPEVIAARGAGNNALPATVQAFVGHAAPGAPATLLEGATLHPGDGILVRYSNPVARDVYLMVFAIDEAHAVHWIHPAYLDEKTNPTSLKLGQKVRERALPEIAEPENPAPGLLRVYALLSPEPLTVKSVEARISASVAEPRVAELFPQTEVEEWRCTWRAK